MPPGKYW